MIRVFLAAAILTFFYTPSIDAADHADHTELLAKHYRLEKPNGEGQRRLVGLGFVILRVNYLAARNVSTPTFVLTVSPEQVASDICIAVGYSATTRLLLKPLG